SVGRMRASSDLERAHNLATRPRARERHFAATGRTRSDMAQSGLVWSRAVVKRNYAILPPEGMATNVLPEWRDTVSRVLTAPAMGARFAQYLLEVAEKGGTTQTLRADIQMFLYVLDGHAELELDGKAHRMAPGGFAYARPGAKFTLEATSP